MAVLGRLGEELGDRLRNVPDTDFVETTGAPQEEIWVSVDPLRLAASGLTANQVAESIRQADAKIRAGQFSTGSNVLFVDLLGEVNSLQRIRSVPLLNNDEGAILRVGDVAQVTRAALDPPAVIARHGGRPAVMVAARMSGDQRVDKWAAHAEEITDAFAAELPPGIALDTVFNQSDYAESRLQDLLWNLLVGVCLVAAILFFTLGWRSALIVVASLR